MVDKKLPCQFEVPADEPAPEPNNDTSLDPSFPPPSYNDIYNTYNGYESIFYPSLATVAGNV